LTPRANFSSTSFLATDQPGKEQYLFGFGVKSAFHDGLSRRGTRRRREASVSEFFETVLGFQERIVVIGVEFVSAITAVIQDNLSGHGIAPRVSSTEQFLWEYNAARSF
jgi:hypothetical protein